MQSVVPDRFLVWPTPFVGEQLLVMMICPGISHPFWTMLKPANNLHVQLLLTVYMPSRSHSTLIRKIGEAML